jgi:hypothetical protein
MVEPSQLPQMSSADAVDFLIENLPISYENYSHYQAISILSCRSWKAEDQNRLAEYYFSAMDSFQSSAFIEFLKIMPKERFIRNFLKKINGVDEREVDLVLYRVRSAMFQRDYSLQDMVAIDDLCRQKKIYFD